MRLQDDDRGVDWKDVAGLFESVGWGQRDPEEVRRAFARSSFKSFAFEGTKLVGMGRSVDDGQYYATIADVVVHPEYQRRGVGTAILQSLQSRMKGFLIITLIAAPDVQKFYHLHGWKRMRTGMMLPRSDAQAAANCEDV